jgi:NAD(P)H dehydrogenase (quinone)
MCSVTVGGPAEAYSEFGAYGPIYPILFPINHGILSFLGFSVVKPFIVHAPARMAQEERAACLAGYSRRLLSLASAATLPCPDMANYHGLVLKAAPRIRAVHTLGSC